MLAFTVRVAHTDRTRTADGHFYKFYAIVDVLAETAVEAKLVAAQMASAIRCEIHGIVIGTTVEWVTVPDLPS